jgi:hypothetical protein
MAHYLVRARADDSRMTELRLRLDNGEIGKMSPFGQALHYSLINARIDPLGWAVWEEEDYCTPPLAQERAAVLDMYFSNLRAEPVPPGQGWQNIQKLPGFWGQ